MSDTEQSLEELQAEIAAMEAKVKKGKGKNVAVKTVASPKEPSERARAAAKKAAGRTAAADQQAIDLAAKKILRTSHSGFAGKSLLEQSEELLDKTIRQYEKANKEGATSGADLNLMLGRCQGMAVIIGKFKNTKMTVEMAEAYDRIATAEKEKKANG